MQNKIINIMYDTSKRQAQGYTNINTRFNEVV